MKDELISFETAKLAKEKGYGMAKYNTLNWKNCYYVCDELELASPSTYITERNGDLIKKYGMSGSTSDPTTIAAAPTQSLLQRWLREVYDIHADVRYIREKCSYFTCIDSKEYNGDNKGTMFLKNVDTYEEALEMGLFEALKLIE